MENCRKAIVRASRGKTGRRKVAYILKHIGEYSERLLDFLKNPEFSPGVDGEIFDAMAGKRRVINKPRFFPDHCAHWAVMQVLEPHFVKTYYPYSCSSIRGRGTHYAKRALERFLKDGKNTKYCLQIDVRHFYHNIDKRRLVALLKRKIKDLRVVGMFRKIVFAYKGAGLPLGWYTSAYLANLYATPLDDYVKRDPGVRYMVRYMDDMVIYGPSKRRLHSLRRGLSSRLGDMGLSMKGNWQVYRMPFNGRGRATDFIGYVFHRTHTTIRGSIWIHIRRALMRGRHCLSFARRFFSYYGYIRCTDSRNVYERYIKNRICIKRLKEVISNETRNEISGNFRAGQACRA